MHRWISQVITEYYNNYNYHISFFIVATGELKLLNKLLSPGGAKSNIQLYCWINSWFLIELTTIRVGKIKILLIHVFEIEMETHVSLWDCQEFKCGFALRVPLWQTLAFFTVKWKISLEFSVHLICYLWPCDAMFIPRDILVLRFWPRKLNFVPLCCEAMKLCSLSINSPYNGPHLQNSKHETVIWTDTVHGPCKGQN